MISSGGERVGNFTWVLDIFDLIKFFYSILIVLLFTVCMEGLVLLWHEVIDLKVWVTLVCS